MEDHHRPLVIQLPGDELDAVDLLGVIVNGPGPFLRNVIRGDRGNGARSHERLQVRARQIDQRELFRTFELNEVTTLQLLQWDMELAFHRHQIVKDGLSDGALQRMTQVASPELFQRVVEAVAGGLAEEGLAGVEPRDDVQNAVGSAA